MRWKIRDPNRFPARFHRAVEEGLRECLRTGSGEVVLLEVEAGKVAQNLMEKFRLFRYGLRKAPAHPLHGVEMGFYLRTAEHPTKVPEVSEIRLTVRRKPDTSQLSAILDE